MNLRSLPPASHKRKSRLLGKLQSMKQCILLIYYYSVDSDIVEVHNHVLPMYGIALLPQMVQPRNSDLINGVDDNPDV